ncbi:unnamed protein product, partial [Polarella glacialis]
SLVDRALDRTPQHVVIVVVLDFVSKDRKLGSQCFSQAPYTSKDLKGGNLRTQRSTKTLKAIVASILKLAVTACSDQLRILVGKTITTTTKTIKIIAASRTGNKAV